MSTETATLSFIPATFTRKPVLGIIKEIPKEIAPQLESAVIDFMETSHSPQGVNKEGFFNQTLESIANCTYLRGNGELWASIFEGKLLSYALASITRDVDGRLTYHVYQAWVCKEYRRNPIVKEWWEQIRVRAKGLFCKHLLITSSRNTEAYKRFLGHGLHEYAVLLKEDI